MNNYMKQFFIIFFIIITSCSHYTPYTNTVSDNNTSRHYAFSSISGYSCSGIYSSYKEFDVDFPREPGCIATFMIASNKNQAIANYNQCIDDLKTYAEHLDKWVNCKKEIVLEYAKNRDKEIINVYNKTLEEAKIYLKEKKKINDFIPRTYITKNNVFYNTCSMIIASDEQCTYQLPKVPYCLEYGRFEIENASECFSDLQKWQSNFKDWISNQLDANYIIAKNRLNKLRQKLEQNSLFL